MRTGDTESDYSEGVDRQNNGKRIITEKTTRQSAGMVGKGKTGPCSSGTNDSENSSRTVSCISYSTRSNAPCPLLSRDCGPSFPPSLRCQIDGPEILVCRKTPRKYRNGNENKTRVTHPTSLTEGPSLPDTEVLVVSVSTDCRGNRGGKGSFFDPLKKVWFMLTLDDRRAR